MKIIIAGSRHAPFSIYAAIPEIVRNSGFEITEVVCGEASGMDTWGKEWAYANGIPVRSFPAEWKLYGKGAGPIRNAEMGDYADGLIAAQWDNSRGTANMIQYMMNLNKPCYVVYNWSA